MLRFFVGVSFALISLSAFPQKQSAQDKVVRLNQIQVVGTHNSYNMGFAPSEAKYFQKYYAKAYHGLEYHHQTLPQQLDAGARQLELDIVQDPQGGRFANPKIVGLTQEEGLPADPDFDPNHDMQKPGFKALHLGDLNERSSCQLFVQCLHAIRTWSHAHKGHVPIFVLVEDKQGRVSQLPDAVTAEPWTAATWDAMDAEIRSVFPEKEIITPDSVRGKFPTLEAAVLAGQWPTLKQSRGKVIFLLYNRKSAPAYLEGHAMMKGRVLFVNGRPGEPEEEGQRDISPARVLDRVPEFRGVADAGEQEPDGEERAHGHEQLTPLNPGETPELRDFGTRHLRRALTQLLECLIEVAGAIQRAPGGAGERRGLEQRQHADDPQRGEPVLHRTTSSRRQGLRQLRSDQHVDNHGTIRVLYHLHLHVEAGTLRDP